MLNIITYKIIKNKNNFFLNKKIKKIILKKNYYYFNHILIIENNFLFYYLKSISIIKDNYLRSRAEFENFKKKSSEELNKSYKYSIEEFSENLLPVIDSLESTLGNKFFKLNEILEGLRLTLELFIKIIKKKNINFIMPKNEDFFDPHKHLAISVSNFSNKKNNLIMNTFQKGYSIFERILRPALVLVNKV